MGVCIKRINCLSMDKDNENYYPSKVCTGDLVTLFFNNGRNIQGRVSSIRHDCVVLEDSNKRKSTFYLKDIKSFNRDFRGSTSKIYF